MPRILRARARLSERVHHIVRIHVIPANLPASRIVAPDGARATIMHDGGHVVSWTPGGESDNRLYVSERSGYGPGQAVRGGIPVIFPQFGPFGPLKQHGFARNCRFSPAHGHDALPNMARLRLTDDEHTRALWPHRFEVSINVLVLRNELRIGMVVINVGDAPFSFTAALHTYFAMQSAFESHVDGLSGLRYRDALRDGEIMTERSTSLAITGPLDRIYYDAPNLLRIRDGNRGFSLEHTHFPDAVVWNPGSEGTASKGDFVPGDEHRMLCVEAGRIQHPHTLHPGEAWNAAQLIRAE